MINIRAEETRENSDYWNREKRAGWIGGPGSLIESPPIL